MYNMYFRFMLLFSGALCVSAAGSHKLCFAFGCFDSSDTQLYATLDEDELGYADFDKGILVWESKVPTTIKSTLPYTLATYYQTICNNDKDRWKPDTSVTRRKAPPDVVLYPRNKVFKDEENTLICFINHFFPPEVNITWSKNDEEVKVEGPFIKSVSRSEGSFYVFSYLNFVPQDGDIYSCTVDHEALEEPKTRFWDIETKEKSSGPAVFCGIAVTLGLLGVAGGTFFFVKGSQHHSGLR